MGFMNRYVIAVLGGLLMGVSQHAGALTEQQKKMLDQLDQLDELDHQEFLVLEGRANSITRSRNFDCAEKNLAAVAAAVNLSSRYCPGGEGKHYIVGLDPRIKPGIVSCKDVYFTSYCPGDAVGTRGVIKNFLGAATDCFMGDAAAVDPTPACKADQTRVVVNRVVGCGE